MFATTTAKRETGLLLKSMASALPVLRHHTKSFMRARVQVTTNFQGQLPLSLFFKNPFSLNLKSACPHNERELQKVFEKTISSRLHSCLSERNVKKQALSDAL